MSRLRPYQASAVQAVFNLWNAGKRNVLMVLPTGAGKTVALADIVNRVGCASAVIAHRGELVSQISVALARENVRHRIIGPPQLIKTCTALHMGEFGRTWYDPNARVGACGVDTLVNKNAARDPWFTQVGLWVQDEAHHVLQTNKWGKAAGMFPNARGLGVTATPIRADGHGLGSHADGLMDAMVVGPSMRDLIDAGYLTDYRVFAPPSDVDYSQVEVTASGDFSPAKLRAAVHASDRIVGDVVQHYLKIARGKLGVTFAVDVESAGEIAAAFRAAGIPAEVVSAKTPDLRRAEILRDFRARRILQLVNVDLFGEGFDLPTIEVVSMVRKTESFSLFVQQFGRALRLMVEGYAPAQWDAMTPDQRRAAIAASGKPCAIIIDHVGNIIRHGLPDAAREWSLDRRERRSNGASDAIPTRVCANVNSDGMGTPCMSVYPRYLKLCPYCHYYPEPPGRTSPEMVDGDLWELTAETLAAMRGHIANAIDGAPRIPTHLHGPAVMALQRNHFERQQMQARLRNVMALWGGMHDKLGHNPSETARLFYFKFGTDVLSAQALNTKDAEAMMGRVTKDLMKNGVTSL